MNVSGKPIIVVVLVMAVTFLVLKITDFPNPSPSPAFYERDDSGQAWEQAKNAVKARLKAPSTAIFPSFRDIQVEKIGTVTYEIYGYVDAQNAFGAMIRTNFFVSVSQVQNNKWKINSVDIDI
jgi:hypothetical protein